MLHLGDDLECQDQGSIPGATSSVLPILCFVEWCYQFKGGSSNITHTVLHHWDQHYKGPGHLTPHVCSVFMMGSLLAHPSRSIIPTFQHIQHSCCSARCVSCPFQHIQPCSNHRLKFQRELLVQPKFFCSCCACCGWCMPKVVCLFKIRTTAQRGKLSFWGRLKQFP